MPDKSVYWALLTERNLGEHNVRSMLEIAAHAAKYHAARLDMTYTRTDMARNNLVSSFLELSSEPNDTLVMFDDDHIHAPVSLERLVSWDVGVVGALTFRRGEPYYPCFFVRDEKSGNLMMPSTWEQSLAKGAIVGTGAIAIQRWVFEKLLQSGYPFPWFRYEYPILANNGYLDADGKLAPNKAVGAGYVSPSEDMYFGSLCEKAGIPHHCDMGLIAPHLGVKVIDDKNWAQWLTDHPELRATETE